MFVKILLSLYVITLKKSLLMIVTMVPINIPSFRVSLKIVYVPLYQRKSRVISVYLVFFCLAYNLRTIQQLCHNYDNKDIFCNPVTSAAVTYSFVISYSVLILLCIKICMSHPSGNCFNPFMHAATCAVHSIVYCIFSIGGCMYSVVQGHEHQICFPR